MKDIRIDFYLDYDLDLKDDYIVFCSRNLISFNMPFPKIGDIINLKNCVSPYFPEGLFEIKKIYYINKKQIEIYLSQ